MPAAFTTTTCLMAQMAHHAEYQKIDVRYGDGTISGDEFAEYYSKKFNLDHGQVSQLFRIFDVDHGGTIDFLE